MILDATFAAVQQIFTPPFRRVFWKTLALTLLLLVFVFVGMERLLVHFLMLPNSLLTTSLIVLAGIALAIGFAFAITPVSFLVGGFFFDELAAIVEAEIDPAHMGRTPPFSDQALVAAKFAALALVLNLAALFLLLVPFVNAVAFVIVNAYLLGRGYFEFAALRYRKIEDMRRMLWAYPAEIFIAGLAIAVLAAVPLVNLLTPLFGAALMVRIHHALSLRETKAR
ncbi:MAG TPA: sulfate transporter family protein [Methylovirgula sp.]|nr:sulfate transporter family protein [Methylovirgula sp.]